MTLTIDIGNTNIVLGCFDGDAILFRERISTNHTATDLEYAVSIKTALEMYRLNPENITGAIVSSVVPSVTNTFRRAIEKLCGVKPLVVGPGIKTGLSIRIDNPAQLGSDLVVDAVAGIHEYPEPQIIIDMGTATTMTVLDPNGAHLGGCVCPGVKISLEALTGNTSLLPGIQLDSPKQALGRNTADAMRSGIMFGTASMLDGMIDRFRAETGWDFTIVATGGLAKRIVPLCHNEIVYDRHLIIKGLARLYRDNAR